MKTLFLDMDGVLANFEKRFEELFNKSANRSRELKEFTSDWSTFIEGGNFATLEWWPGAQELLEFVDNIPNINIEILSSSGGAKYHKEVTEQKQKWLQDHGIKYKQNIIPGSRLKANYAKGSDTILVDDTDYVIAGFIESGGIGILHRDLGNTKQLIIDALAV
jgi:hypothetical protein